MVINDYSILLDNVTLCLERAFRPSLVHFSCNVSVFTKSMPLKCILFAKPKFFLKLCKPKLNFDQPTREWTLRIILRATIKSRAICSSFSPECVVVKNSHIDNSYTQCFNPPSIAMKNGITVAFD
jgi:hypothetical protein